jgi:hypothetical protein
VPPSDLSALDTVIVGDCLRAVASGRIFENDREFPTIFGISFDELGAVCDSWPQVDEADPVVELAVCNSLNNLVGYPHGRDDILAEFVAVPRQELIRILQAWKG